MDGWRGDDSDAGDWESHFSATEPDDSGIDPSFNNVDNLTSRFLRGQPGGTHAPPQDPPPITPAL